MSIPRIWLQNALILFKTDSRISLRWSKNATIFMVIAINPLNVNPTKWSNTLKQFVANFAFELFECV